MGPTEPHNQVQIYFCAICGGPGGSRHHLIPKSIRRLRGEKRSPEFETDMATIIWACWDCHREIHWYFSNWELATKFNTAGSLKEELEKRKAEPLAAVVPNPKKKKRKRLAGAEPEDPVRAQEYRDWLAGWAMNRMPDGLPQYKKDIAALKQKHSIHSPLDKLAGNPNS